MKRLLSLILFSMLLCSCGSSSDKLRVVNKELAKLNAQIQEEERQILAQIQQTQNQINQVQEQLKLIQSQQNEKIVTLNTQLQEQIKQHRAPHKRSHHSRRRHYEYPNRENAEFRGHMPQQPMANQNRHGFLWFNSNRPQRVNSAQ